MKLKQIVSKTLNAPRAISRGIQEALDSWFEMAPYNISILAQSFSGSTVTGFGGKGFDPKTANSYSVLRRREMLTWHFLASDRAMFGRFSTSAGLKWISLGELYLDFGNPGNALRYALKGLEIVEGDRVEDPSDKILYSARSRVAHVLLKLSQHEEASLILKKLVATHLAREKLDDKFVELSMALSKCQVLSGNPDSAASTLLRLTEVLERDGMVSSDEAIKAYKELGLVYKTLQDLSKAEVFAGLSDALDWLNLMEKSTGKESRTLLSELKKLESLYSRAGKPTLASYASERISIINIKARVDGPDYPGIAGDLDRLAAYYEKRDEGGDKTIAFHLRARKKRIEDKASGR